MTNRVPRYDTDGDGKIDEYGLDADQDAIWSHLDTINRSDAPFDRSQITTVTNVSAGANASTTVSNVSAGEMLVFPSGTFTWDATADIGSVSNWGVICQDDTFFEVLDGFGRVASGIEPVLNTASGTTDNVLLENLTFTTANSSDRACPGIRLQVSSQAYVNGLHYDVNGTQQQGDNEMNAIEPWVADDPGGRIRVDDLVQHNNGDIGVYSGSERVGSYIGPVNVGTVTFVRPVLEGFPNNGLYVSRTDPKGRVIVEDGLLMNNNVSSVRVGSKIEVYNTTIYVNESSYVSGDGSNSGLTHNTRGAWFENKNDTQPNGGLVQGCSFVFEDVDNSTGAVVSSLNQWCNVRDCQFLINAGLGTFDGVVNAENTDIRMNVYNSTFDGSASRTIGVGSGTTTGRDNYYNDTLSPGSLPVVDNANYEFDWSRTHPDTPGRPAGAGSVTAPSELAFRSGLRASDDGDGTVTVDAVETPYKDLVNHGVITASGGSTPAYSGTAAVNAFEDETFIIVLRPRDPLSWNANYAFSYSWGHSWDDSAGVMNASVEVTWDTDPGAGNDLELRWEARRL